MDWPTTLLAAWAFMTTLWAVYAESRAERYYEAMCRWRTRAQEDLTHGLTPH